MVWDPGYTRKLTDEQVVEMRQMYAEPGVSIRALAKQYKISWQAAHNALSGKTYRHCAGPLKAEIEIRAAATEHRSGS